MQRSFLWSPSKHQNMGYFLGASARAEGGNQGAVTHMEELSVQLSGISSSHMLLRLRRRDADTRASDSDSQPQSRRLSADSPEGYRKQTFHFKIYLHLPNTELDKHPSTLKKTGRKH